MSEYRIVIADDTGTEIGEFTKWDRVSFDFKLNDFGKCEFSVPYNDEKLTSLSALRRYDTKIYKDNSLIWAGQQVYRRGDLNSKNSGMVSITSYDYVELLAHKYTDEYVSYANTDAGSIAWGLIDTAQNRTNGDFGITQGTIETTKNRDRTYEYDNVLKEIVRLTEVKGGFDFEITPSKVFNVFDRKGVDKTSSVVFEWGTNIDRITIDEDASSLINSTTVVGRDSSVERNNNTLAAIFNRYEDAISEPSVSEVATLEDKGDANNDKYKTSLLKVDFEQMPGKRPLLGSVSTGDIVKLRVNEGIYNIDNNYRVYGISVDVNSENVEYISYELGLI